MTNDPTWREAMRGTQAQPAPAPQPGETPEQFHANQQTQLLTKMASDISTMRKIAVFFTVLWGIGAVILVLSLFG